MWIPSKTYITTTKNISLIKSFTSSIGGRYIDTTVPATSSNSFLLHPIVMILCVFSHLDPLHEFICNHHCWLLYGAITNLVYCMFVLSISNWFIYWLMNILIVCVLLYQVMPFPYQYYVCSLFIGYRNTMVDCCIQRVPRAHTLMSSAIAFSTPQYICHTPVDCCMIWVLYCNPPHLPCVLIHTPPSRTSPVLSASYNNNKQSATTFSTL